jgi:hypothetical protein
MRKTTKQLGWLHQTKRHHYSFTPLLILLACFIMEGCRSKPLLPTPTVEVIPTSTVTTFLASRPTEYPLAPLSPSATPRLPIHLKTRTYQHPEDLFTLLVPESWKINPDQNSASFSDPQGKAVINAYSVNTGYPLDAESFQRFIDARESNVFSGYENFFEIDRQYGVDGNSTIIQKQFSNQGMPKSVETLYQQQGQAILILDFWSDQIDFEAYQDSLKQILESVRINPDAVSSQQIYSSEGGKTTQNNYFSVTVPPYWGIRHTSGEKTVVDTFSSPDERAFLQTVIYDDGVPMSRMVAANLMRTLLREQYAKDVDVYSDTLLADGREKLAWNSKLGNYQGITWFEPRGTALLALTTMWDSDLTGYYQDALEDMVNTYKVLSPGESTTTR